MQCNLSINSNATFNRLADHCNQCSCGLDSKDLLYNVNQSDTTFYWCTISLIILGLSHVECWQHSLLVSTLEDDIYPDIMHHYSACMQLCCGIPFLFTQRQNYYCVIIIVKYLSMWQQTCVCDLNPSFFSCLCNCLACCSIVANVVMNSWMMYILNSLFGMTCVVSWVIDYTWLL